MINSISKADLFILDDFGLNPLDTITRLALFHILEDRYGIKSTMIISQLPTQSWYDYIAEPTLADAIMDRLFSSAHRFDLKGESFRKKTIKNLYIFDVISVHSLNVFFTRKFLKNTS
jgi:DNA replication protein DnaC